MKKNLPSYSKANEIFVKKSFYFPVKLMLFEQNILRWIILEEQNSIKLKIDDFFQEESSGNKIKRKCRTIGSPS